MKTRAPLGRYTEQVRLTAPPSRRVAFIAGYYRFTAIAGAVSMAGALTFAAMRHGALWTIMREHPLALLTWPLSIATSWWTGQVIGDRQRLGAWVALSSIGLGLTNALVAQRATWGMVAFGTIGLVAIASIWKELE